MNVTATEHYSTWILPPMDVTATEHHTAHGFHRRWTSPLQNITAHGFYRRWTSPLQNITQHMDFTADGRHRYRTLQHMDFTADGRDQRYKFKKKIAFLNKDGFRRPLQKTCFLKVTCFFPKSTVFFSKKLGKKTRFLWLIK